MKILPYILIGIACFALGWFARPGGKAVHDTDTIQSPPIVVTKTRVDTLILLFPAALHRVDRQYGHDEA